MIVGSLYPTDDTKDVGNNPNPLTTATTDYWGSTDGSVTVNSPESYWLGYISKENLPSMYHTNIIYLDDDDPNDKKIVVKDLTDDGNFPCTYIQRGIDYSSELYVESFHKEYDGVVSDLVGNPYKRYLFNQNYAEYSGLLYNNNSYQRSTTASIDILCYIYDATGNTRIYPSEYPITGQLWKSIFYSSGSTYIDDLYKFLYLGEEYTFSIRFPDSGTWYTYDFTIKAEDLADGTGIIWDVNNQVQLRFFIIGFDFGTGGALRNGGAITFGASFMAKVTGHDAEHTISVLRDGHGGHGYNEKINFASNFYWGTPARYENPLFTYGYKEDVEFGYDAVMGVSQSNTVPYIYTDIAICFSYDGGQWFLPYYNLDDVKKSFSLFYRVCRSNVDSYVSGVSYATDVAPDNQFLARLKTGNITDPTFKHSLRQWQYDEFTDNDFTEEDVPHPSPEPGGDTPGDEPQNMPHDDGDPPELQKNRTIAVPAMFITQYALTADELQTVGSNLWTSWLNQGTDVYLNFFLPYAQDFGTLNIGAALDFIVSLKVFPFEFTIDYITPAANGVRMGTGHTDFLGSSTTIVKSQIICIDAGTLKVELPNPYNDFRDMYNCSALCFMPYCGTVELNLQEILGRTLKASYFIDLQSGGCTCVIECAGDEGDYVIASKTGQIGFSIPLTATNAGQLTAQLMSDATRAVGTIAGTFFSNINKNRELAMNIAGLNQGAQNGMDFDYAQTKADYYQQKANLGVAEGTLHGALGLANQGIDMLSRSAVEMPMLSGGGSAEAFMFADCVSIQIRRGRYKKPDNYPHSIGHYNLSSHPISYFKGAFTGNPSTGSNTNKGFCTFVGIDTSGLDCRDDERAEIISLLESGVYL